MNNDPQVDEDGFVEYGKSWSQFTKEFEGRLTGLIVRHGIDEELIGDVNNYGSPCSCCSISDYSTIDSYKRVYP